MKRTTLITIFIIACLVGLWLGQAWLTAVPALILAAGAAALLTRNSRALPLALLALGLSIGVWRGDQSLMQYAVLQQQIGRPVSVVGRVADDPAANDRGNVQFDIDHLRLNGQPVPGQIEVTSYHVELQRGYLVRLDGKLKPGFAAKPAGLSFAKIQIISVRQSLLERWRQRFFAGLRTELPDPLAPLALGLLVGVRALISKDLQTQLAALGLSHLIAVSGYNLTIIVQAARRILGRRSKFLTAAVIAWLIGGFVVVAGMSPSILRAAAVSGLILAAGYYGREFKPLVLIGLAALMTAGFNPWYLTRDVGWQLSFLAFFGILVLAPLLKRRFRPNAGVLTALILESFCAQVMTFPLIMLIFGQISLISPLANALVLPLVPLAMLTAATAALTGWLHLPGLLAQPAVLVLSLISKAVDYLSHISWAARPIQPSQILTLEIYAAIVALVSLLTLSLARQSRRSGDTIAVTELPS